ncbi:MAG: hypothetical protein GY793_09610 [Proteobacteria bacterium]|nr:hypothetical protein [Pseudomonadota bacterium]
MKMKKSRVQKAAMFGLDARVALAIFGALSVITGATLYNVIQDSKVIAVINDLNEIGKAYDAYLLDTGTQLPINVTSPRFLNIEELLTSTKIGWQGPYLNYNNVGTTSLSSAKYMQISISYRPTADWGESMNGTPNVALPASCDTAPCYVWPMVYASTKFAKKIDIKVDGVLNGKSGKIRLWCGTELCYIYYKYAPAVIQP